MAFSLCAAIRSVLGVRTRKPSTPLDELTLPLMGAKEALSQAESAIAGLVSDDSSETYKTLKEMMDQSLKCIEICESIVQRIQYLDANKRRLASATEVESLWANFCRQIPIVALNLTSIQYYLSALKAPANPV